MSDSLGTPPIYTVTSISSSAEQEGSLAWAFAQAEAWTGEGYATIYLETDDDLNASDIELHNKVRIIAPEGSTRSITSLITIREGASLCIGKGVELQSATTYGTLQLEAGSSAGILRALGESATLDIEGARITGSLEIEDGKTALRCTDTAFDLAEFITLRLTAWDGSRLSFNFADSFINCSFPEGSPSRISCIIDGLGGRQLLWDEEATLPLLMPEGFSQVSGVQLTLEEGDHLILPDGYQQVLRSLSNLTIQAGSTLEVGEACRLENLTIHTDATLLSRGLTISGELELYPEAQLSGPIHMEEGSALILRNWEGGIPDILTKGEWSSDGPVQIRLQDIAVGEQVTLSKLDENIGWYSIGGILEGDLTLEEGVSLSVGVSNFLDEDPILQNWFGLLSDDAAVSIRNGSKLTLEGNNTILTYGKAQDLYFLVDKDSTLECGSGCQLDTVALKDGATLTADQVSISGAVTMEKGAHINGSIHFQEDASINLWYWTGDMTELAANTQEWKWSSDGPLNINLSSVAEGGQVTLNKLDENIGWYSIGGFLEGDLTLEEGVDLFLGAFLMIFEGVKLTLEGNNDLLLNQNPDQADITLLDGASLECGTGCRLGDVDLSPGASMECGTDCRLGDVTLRDGASMKCGAGAQVSSLRLENGSTLVSEGLTITDKLMLERGAQISGPISLAEGATLHLGNLSGDINDALAEILTEYEWISDFSLGSIHLHLHLMDVETGKTLRLTKLEDGATVYVIDGMSLLRDSKLIVEEGVELALEGDLACVSGGQIIFEGNNIVRQGESGQGRLYLGRKNGLSTIATATRFEVPVELETTDSLTGKHVTFANELVLHQHIFDWADYGLGTNLEGLLEKYLWNLLTYNIDEATIVLEIDTLNLSQELILNETTIDAILPEGVSQLRFGAISLITAEELITVTAGTSLDTRHLSVHGSGALIMESGSELINSEGEPTSLSNYGGRMVLNGAELNGASINHYKGSLSMINCTGIGALNVGFWDDESCIISGCDLSAATITIDSVNAVSVDLSGNYWGTTDLEEIKARIRGYDESLIILNDVLESLPTAEGNELTVTAFREAHQGSSEKLTLTWNTQPGLRYEVTIDDTTTQLEEGSNSYSVILDKGTHLYAVKAIDDKGYTTSHAGVASITSSASTHVPPLGITALYPQKDGSMLAKISWATFGSASFCILSVDGNELYRGTETELILPVNQEQRYALKLSTQDEHGVFVSQELSFHVPEFSMADIARQVTGKGKTQASFIWKSAGCILDGVTIDNKEQRYNAQASSWTGVFKDGEHEYSLRLLTEENIPIVVHGSFSTDATAPVFKLDKKTGLTITPDQETGTGRVAFNTNCEETEGITCTVTLDQESSPAWQGPGITPVIEGVGEGKHSYIITLTDSSGNSSSQKGTFSIDASAPTLTLNAAKLKESKKTNEVSASLSWKGESGCTYSLFIDGEEIISAASKEGKKTSYTHNLTPGGSFSWQVIAWDKAGNHTMSDIRTIRDDREAPEVSDLTHAMHVDEATGQAISTFRWSARDASGITCTLKVDGKVATILNTEGQTDFSYEHSATLKPGKHSYELLVTDWQGNTTTFKGKEYQFSTPKLSLGKPVLVKAGEGMVAATLNWKGEKNSTCTLVLDGGESTTLTDDGKGNYSYQPATALRDGLHHYRVTAYDASAGTCTVAEGNFSYDATAPGFILGALSGVVVSAKNKPDKVKATLEWAGEEGVSYTIMLGNKKVYSGKNTSCTYSFELSEYEGHELRITAKDKAGNVSAVTSAWLKVGVSNGQAELAWSSSGNEESTPADAQQLSWQSADTAGIAAAAEAGNSFYCFELEEARQVLVHLSGLEEHATLQLQQAGGQGSISLAANAGAGLDQELSLSAGTYYLAVKESNGTDMLTSAYTLDLELEQNGKKQAFAQAILAS